MRTRRMRLALAGAVIVAAVVAAAGWAATDEQSVEPPPPTDPEKLAIRERYAADRRAAERVPPRVAGRPDERSPFADVPQGIQETTESPLPRAAVSVVNMWQDVVDGSLVQVWAGSRAHDAGQGLIVVTVSHPDGRREIKTYAVPDGGGSARITHAEGRILTVKASGRVLRFDITARRFV